jgi:putative ABC transport system permease protein
MNAWQQNWKQAWLNVQRNRRRSLVTLLIATLGTAALLIAGGFAAETYDSLREAAARDSGHLTVATAEYFQRDEDTPLQYGLDHTPALIRQLEDQDGVRQVLPRISLSGLVSNGDKSMVFVGTGARIQAEASVRGPFLQLLAGELPQEDGKNRIVLGKDLAASLNAHPGSGLTLLTNTVSGSMNAIDVEVAGIVSTGWQEIDKRLVYAPLALAQQLLATDKVSTLAVFLDDTAATPATLAAWQQQPAFASYAFKPWWEQAFYYNSVRQLYNRIFGMLGVIIAALVFFAVSNTLSMAVVERTREIGTLRAIGALPGEIVGGFLREGAVIGGIGSVLGMVLAGLTALGMILFDPQMPPPPGRSEGYPLRIQVDPAL